MLRVHRKNYLTRIGDSRRSHSITGELETSMKAKSLVSGKGAIALGLAAGILIGCLVGYWTYTQVITTLIGRRQIVIVTYSGFLQIINVEMGYDGDGNIDIVEVTVKNSDDANAHSGILTAGEMEKTPKSANIDFLPSEERTVFLEITPPITPSEEIIILVGVEEMTD